MTPREVLLAAADFVSQHPASSAVYAIRATCKSSKAGIAAWRRLLDSFGAGKPRRAHDGRDYTAWEAAPGRTRDEVVRALREAAR